MVQSSPFRQLHRYTLGGGGLATILFGTWLRQTTFTTPLGITIAKILAELLPPLSGSLIAGGVAAIFLSFQEVRDQLANIFSTSLSNGSMINLLSPSARDSFEKQILLNKLSDKVSTLEPGLLDHLQNISTECLQMLHFNTFKVKEQITPYDADQSFNLSDFTIFFRVQSHHLKNPEVNFEYRLLHKILVKNPDDYKDIKIMYDLRGFLGELVLEDKHIKKTIVYEEGDHWVKSEIEADVKFQGEIDCCVEFKLLRPKSEKVTACFARYPTLGFFREVYFDEEHVYDGYFFKGKNPKFEDFPAPKKIRRQSNGIGIYTFDWVLPGEGVVIQWFPKK